MTMDYEEYILQHFQYHSDGTLTRDDRKNSLGSLDKDGYVIIKVKGKQFKAHRIVWLLNHGKFPIGVIDHINRCRTDNRIENLRDVSQSINNKNAFHGINPKTRVEGIYLDEVTKGLRAKYTFRHNKKTYRFRTLDEAIEKREELRNGRL